VIAFSSKLITAPAAPLITLDEAKAHCRVDHTDDDTLIESIVEAVTSHLDGYHGMTHRALVTQRWEDAFTCFDGDMRLTQSPCASIVSVTYTDGAGSDLVIDSAQYAVLTDIIGSFVIPAPGLSWPMASAIRRDAVRIRYDAGQSAADVPASIKAAALLMIGDLYRNRETAAIGAQASEIPMSATVNALLAPFRRSILA
jgi:uncharacterized phiE125 gp8 family phage protein